LAACSEERDVGSCSFAVCGERTESEELQVDIEFADMPIYLLYSVRKLIPAALSIRLESNPTKGGKQPLSWGGRNFKHASKSKIKVNLNSLKTELDALSNAGKRFYT